MNDVHSKLQTSVFLSRKAEEENEEAAKKKKKSRKSKSPNKSKVGPHVGVFNYFRRQVVLWKSHITFYL